MKSLIAPLIALIVASPLAAQEHEPLEPGPEVSGLLDALAAEDRDDAISRIKGIFALVDNDRFVRTPSAFVDLVIGCPSKQVEAKVNDFFQLYTYRWDCTDGVYQASLGKDPDSNYVEVVDPADEARLAARAVRPPAAPPMLAPLPAPESPEQRAARFERQGRAELAALEALEPQLKAGRLTDASALATRANFTTGYRDLAQSTFITELDGDGMQAANSQLAWLSESLGEPDTVECRQTRSEIGTTGYISFFSSCTVRSERPGHGYTALVFFRDAKIASIQFNYVNPMVFEKNREFIEAKGGAN